MQIKIVGWIVAAVSCLAASKSLANSAIFQSLGSSVYKGRFQSPDYRQGQDCWIRSRIILIGDSKATFLHITIDTLAEVPAGSALHSFTSLLPPSTQACTQHLMPFTRIDRPRVSPFFNGTKYNDFFELTSTNRLAIRGQNGKQDFHCVGLEKVASLPLPPGYKL